jgi:hypothetical protein
VARLKNHRVSADPFRGITLVVDCEHVVLLAHNEPAWFVTPRRICDLLVVRSGGIRTLRTVEQFDFRREPFC